MTTPTPVPAAMIEAAAKALHEHDRLCGEPAFDQLQEWDQQSYESATRAVLTAALSVCEVREQYGWIHGEPGTEEYRAGWFASRVAAERPEGWPGFRPAWRLIVTTPPTTVLGGSHD